MENLNFAEDLNKQTRDAQAKLEKGGKEAREAYFELQKLQSEAYNGKNNLQEQATKENYEYNKNKYMKIMVELEEKEELTKDDLAFLYGIKNQIRGFEVHKDRRISEIRDSRDWKEDMSTIFEANSDSDLALKLIERGDFVFVTRHLESFKEDSHSDIANKLIEVGEGTYLVYELTNFKNLNYSDIANKLIEAGQDEAEAVAKNLKEFKDVNHSDIANKLIEEGRGGMLANYIYNFKGIDHRDIMDKLIKTGRGDFATLLMVQSNELNLSHSEIANKLIEGGLARSVEDYIGRFKSLSPETADKLIEAGEGMCVLRNYEKFGRPNVSHVADKLIEARQGYLIFGTTFDYFERLDRADLAKKLTDAGEDDLVERHLPEFKQRP